MSLTKQTDHVLFEIQQEEYFYWETFCDSFIERCTQIIDIKQENSKKYLHDFQKFKECLELILFTVDVSKQEKKCILQLPITFLSLLQLLMKKWHKKLKQELQQVRLKQMGCTNGENKRQLFNRKIQLEEVLTLNAIVMNRITNYRRG
ncbi:hypothetical protein [Virgibacillus halodenitrificans]|uniref:hypothetical protein n=1 Tax=Virgibacillus halodenitrificans TaxID=1482 RepID=UPI000EF450EA|nr:hypothetical protein [Virgibacillus halodenitrificans]